MDFWASKLGLASPPWHPPRNPPAECHPPCPPFQGGITLGSAFTSQPPLLRPLGALPPIPRRAQSFALPGLVGNSPGE